MFRILFYKELLEYIHNYRFIIALLLCVTMIPLSFYVNWTDYQARELNYKESLRLYEESHKSILDVIQLGGATFRPPSPLSMLSSGLENILPNSVETSSDLISYLGAQTKFNTSQSLNTPFSFLYGHIDLVFVVSIIMSLIAMLFTYNSVAGEKERRTLNLIFSNSVSRNILVLAKISVTFLLLSLFILLGIAIGLFILLIMGSQIIYSGSLFLRFALCVGTSLLFIFVLINFGVFISCLNKNSIMAIVSIMFCWVFWFTVIPKGSVAISKIFNPVKSQQVIDLEKDQIRLQIEKETRKEALRIEENMPAIKEMSRSEYFVKLSQGDQNVKSFEEKQGEIKKAFRVKCEAELYKIDSYYESKRNNQAIFAKYISRLSPVSCFIHLITEMSDTGFLEYEQLKQTSMRFKNLIDAEISNKAAGAWFGDGGYSTFRGDYKAPMPKVEFRRISLASVLKNVMPDFILLVFYGFLFFTGAYVAFLKYDLR